MVVELAGYLAGNLLGVAIVTVCIWRHRIKRRRSHPGFEFVDAVSSLTLLAFLSLPIILQNVVLPWFREGREASLVVLGLGCFVAWTLLYLTRSEISWSDETLAARRWPGPDIELVWDDIRQAGISEIFMRVWVTDAQGRTIQIGKATRTSKLAEEMAARLGERFIGIRKPQPVPAE